MADLSVQRYNYTLNYVFALPVTGKTSENHSPAARVLAQLFLPANEDADDDGRAWLTPPAGFEVEEVVVGSVGRQTDTEEQGVGRYTVSIEVLGHSYGVAPIDVIAAAIVDHVRANRAGFPFPLLWVAHDDYWARNLADLADRLPAVIVQFEDAPFSRP